jgi:hypothetical protein
LYLSILLTISPIRICRGEGDQAGK